jgi:glycosyltransferase involved in cell wall biosynthesis
MSGRVSIVIPSYNAARYVEDAVQSVLAQGHPDLEAIVVDDGSTDDTRSRVERFGPRIRYYWQPNAGVSSARNQGFRLSGGEYLTFLDADDVLEPGFVSKMIRVFEEEAEVGLAFSYYYVAYEGVGPKISWSINVGSHRKSKRPVEHLLRDNFIGPPSCVMVRRQWMDRVSGFDESLSAAADRDLYLRVALAGARVHCVREPLVTYRDRRESMS